MDIDDDTDLINDDDPSQLVEVRSLFDFSLSPDHSSPRRTIHCSSIDHEVERIVSTKVKWKQRDRNV